MPCCSIFSFCCKSWNHRAWTAWTFKLVFLILLFAQVGGPITSVLMTPYIFATAPFSLAAIHLAYTAFVLLGRITVGDNGPRNVSFHMGFVAGTSIMISFMFLLWSSRLITICSWSRDACNRFPEIYVATIFSLLYGIVELSMGMAATCMPAIIPKNSKPDADSSAVPVPMAVRIDPVRPEPIEPEVKTTAGGRAASGIV